VLVSSYITPKARKAAARGIEGRGLVAARSRSERFPTN
jgi:hypothetical protein